MELKFILESLLFSAQKPLSVKELRDVLATAKPAKAALTVLMRKLVELANLLLKNPKLSVAT